MGKTLIVADDFTGALDTGVHFSEAGIKTRVFLHWDIDWSVLNGQIDVDVLVVDTESRHLEPAKAYERVFSLCKEATLQGIEYFYKKTDSTLRGNVGAEISALMDACDIKDLPFIPAYPEAGRTTEKGYQLVFGKKIHEGVFAKDPLNPVSDSYIPNILKSQTNKDISIYPRLAEGINAAYGEKRGIKVFDSETAQDMKDVSDFLISQKGIKGIAGCAGFAPYITELYDLKPSSKIKEQRQQLKKPLLIICGSLNKASLSQVSCAEKMGINSLKIDLESISSNEENIARAKDYLSKGSSVILKTYNSDEKGDSLGDNSEEKKFEDLGRLSYKEITYIVGSVTKKIIEGTKIKSLVVFGGDTALGIVKELNCQTIVPHYEIFTGLPVSNVKCRYFEGSLITKAGGFGGETTLVDLIEAFD